MDPATTRRFGRVDLPVTQLGFGGGPIGNIFRRVSEDAAAAIVNEAWDAGVRFFDTAPMYGHGLSESRLGAALRWRRRDDFVISSKVGRVLTAAPRHSVDFSPWVDGLPNRMRFDYSYDGTLRSLEDSLQRLGLERIDIVFIHDCDVFTHGAQHQPGRFREAMDGAWRALDRMRAEGVVRAIGVGVNEWQVCHAALQERDFDCFLLAGRYTLLEQEALDEFLPLCEARGAAVVLGAAYNSGILATGATPGAKYNYAPAPESILTRVRGIEAVCTRHGVPLKAAAMQFVLGHPAIPTTVPGCRSVAQMAETIEAFRHVIPAAFWAELKSERLLRGDAPVPT
jgi:D-threo-aldose 1-dehydrogenase